MFGLIDEASTSVALSMPLRIACVTSRTRTRTTGSGPRRSGYSGFFSGSPAGGGVVPVSGVSSLRSHSRYAFSISISFFI
jgi:hypothetical protein